MNLIIKDVVSIVPGFGEAGKDFGELITTEEILDRMMASGENGKRRIKNDFLKSKLGIESVAFTHATKDFCRKEWNQNPRANRTDLFRSLYGRENTTLYEMLATAIRKATKSLANGNLSSRIAGHIHIVTYAQPSLEYELQKIRRDLELYIEDSSPTFIIQQGCAGLFSAIKLAQKLLSSSDVDHSDNILITAENNMMTHGHQRAALTDDHSSIDSWLWPAIFGEGVGAMVVGRSDEQKQAASWTIDSIFDEIVETDWRVKSSWNQDLDTTEVVVKSSAVKQTYLKNIAKQSRLAIENCQGEENIFRLCLHESNPRIVRRVADTLNFPHEKVPTISAITGTLACVSAFSLMDIATSDFEKASTLSYLSGDKIALGLIGEACGSVRAGNMTLSPNFTRSDELFPQPH